MIWRKYCEMLSTCFLKTPTWSDQAEIAQHINAMNDAPDKVGLITELYSPSDTCDRWFYTPENAKRIDGMIDYIERCVPEHLRAILPWSAPGEGEYSHKHVGCFQRVS
jgi:adenine-specific DNA-methyltransferase